MFSISVLEHRYLFHMLYHGCLFVDCAARTTIPDEFKTQMISLLSGRGGILTASKKVPLGIRTMEADTRYFLLLVYM